MSDDDALQARMDALAAQRAQSNEDALQARMDALAARSASARTEAAPAAPAGPATDGSATEAAKTFGNDAANTASLNLWRNGQAAYDAYANGKPFNQAYDEQKALDEARSAAHPYASTAGTVAGLAGPILATVGSGGTATGATAPVLIKGVSRLAPALDGVMPAVGRAVKAGAYGAGMGGAAEYLDSKDVNKAGAAALGGAVLGAAANPVVEKAGSLAMAGLAKSLGSGGDRAVLKAVGATDAAGNPLTSRWQDPTFDEARVAALKDKMGKVGLDGLTDKDFQGLKKLAPIAPTEEAKFDAVRSVINRAGHKASEVLPYALGVAGGGLGGMHGGLAHGVMGALEGAVGGGVGSAIGHWATDRLVPVGDRYIDKQIAQLQSKYAQPWQMPWQFQAPEAAGLLGGTAANDVVDNLDRPLRVKVRPNNR